MWSISDQLLMVHMGVYLSDCYSYLGESFGIWGPRAVAVCHRMTIVARRREYTQKKTLSTNISELWANTYGCLDLSSLPDSAAATCHRTQGCGGMGGTGTVVKASTLHPSL